MSPLKVSKASLAAIAAAFLMIAPSVVGDPIDHPATGPLEQRTLNDPAPIVIEDATVPPVGSDPVHVADQVPGTGATYPVWDGSDEVPVFGGVDDLGRIEVTHRGAQEVCLLIVVVETPVHDGCLNAGVLAGEIPDETIPLGTLPAVAVPPTNPIDAFVPPIGPVDTPPVEAFPGTQTSEWKVDPYIFYRYDCSKFTTLYEGEIGPDGSVPLTVQEPINVLDPGHVAWFAAHGAADTRVYIRLEFFENGVEHPELERTVAISGLGHAYGFYRWTQNPAYCE